MTTYFSSIAAPTFRFKKSCTQHEFDTTIKNKEANIGDVIYTSDTRQTYVFVDNDYLLFGDGINTDYKPPKEEKIKQIKYIHCPSCGAPVNTKVDHCEYCDTPYIYEYI